MNKEEILEKSRRENKGRDECERDALAQGGKIAAAVGGVVCAAVILLEAIFSDFASYSTWAVYLSMTGSVLLVKFAKMRKKHELIFGALQILLALVFFAIYITKLVE